MLLSSELLSVFLTVFDLILDDLQEIKRKVRMRKVTVVYLNMVF